MTEWQPIETAPPTPFGRDHVRILVWVADGGNRRQGIAAFGWAYEDYKGSIVGAAEGYNGDWDITHWAEVTPPSQSEAKE